MAAQTLRQYFSRLLEKYGYKMEQLDCTEEDTVEVWTPGGFMKNTVALNYMPGGPKVRIMVSRIMGGKNVLIEADYFYIKIEGEDCAWSLDYHVLQDLMNRSVEVSVKIEPSTSVTYALMDKEFLKQHADRIDEKEKTPIGKMEKMKSVPSNKIVNAEHPYGVEMKD